MKMDKNKWLMVIAGIVLLFVIVILLKLWLYILALLVGAVGGFILGRKSTNYIVFKDNKAKDREGFL